VRQYTDELGVAYSAGLADSIESFNRMMDAYLASRNTVMPMLEALLEQDPEMPMALCFRGYLLKLAADPGSPVRSAKSSPPSRRPGTH